MNIYQKTITALLASLLCMAPLQAQEQPFQPVMTTFSGKSALVMPPVPALEIQGAGTIEFWVSADWNGDPGYDPAIISYSGSQGPRFAFHITSDKQALGVYAGQYYDTVPFNFADGYMHYVAIIIVGDSMDVLIDGESRGELGYGIAKLPAESFSVGSLGNFSPFIGEIGQVRIWDEPIDPDVLNDFSWRAIETEGPNAHPDIDSLIGASTFGNPETSGFIFVGAADDPNIAVPDDAAFDDSDFEQPTP